MRTMDSVNGVKDLAQLEHQVETMAAAQKCYVYDCRGNGAGGGIANHDR